MKTLKVFGFTLLGIFFFSTQVSAQNFGIRAGLNYADISGIEDGSDAIIGLQFGPVAEFGLSESLDLHVGALYAMKGAQDDDSDAKLNMNYIDIPVLLHFDLGGLYLEAGPQLSLLLSADSEGVDAKDLFKSSDFSAVLGVGFDLGTLRFDLRYGLGLSNIADTSFGVEDSLKNGVFTLGASYMFGGSDSGEE